MTKFLNHKKIAAAFLFAFSLTCFICTTLLAQTPVNINPTVAPDMNAGNPTDSVNVVDNGLNNPLDSLASTSEVGPSYPVFPDSVYASRIHSLPTSLPVIYNDDVRRFIDLYTLRKRDQVERMVGLSKIYFPVFEQILMDNQVPTDLKYLAIIESALNPNAVSRCGAVGTWQFMFSTAKLYGLKVNGYVDERKDIIQSTAAAAVYLKNMYAIYGDWLLSIAAYNCGPGNINRAINLSGGSTDFWTISRYLPKETRSYVPAFIAAMYVMNYYDTHDISPQYPDYNICDIASIDVFDKVSFEEIAKLTDMPVDEIKFLNPGLRGDVVPALGSEPYSLKLPAEKMPMFEQMKDSIVYLSRGYMPTFCTSYRGRYSRTAAYHTVRKGETLNSLADKNNCSIAQIKKWNHLKGNAVHAGQKIKILSYAFKADKVSGKKTGASNHTYASASTKSKVVYYKVKSGDTLWRISNKYPGVTVADIRAANGSSKVKNLQPGMVLKIKI